MTGIEPRIFKGADDADFDSGRRALPVFARPGVAKKNKRRINRRERTARRRDTRALFVEYR